MDATPESFRSFGRVLQRITEIELLAALSRRGAMWTLHLHGSAIHEGVWLLLRLHKQCMPKCRR